MFHLRLSQKLKEMSVLKEMLSKNATMNREKKFHKPAFGYIPSSFLTCLPEASNNITIKKELDHFI